MGPTDNTQRLDRLCDRFRTALKLRHLLTAAAMLIVLAVLLAGAFMAADWWRHFGWPVRLVLLVVYLAAVCSATWLTLIRPMTRRWSNRQVLSYLDATSPQGRDMLVDLYELSAARDQIQEIESAQGRELVDQALADLTPLAAQVRPRDSFVARPTRRCLLAAGIVLAAACGLAIGFPAHARSGIIRLFNPFSTHRWPHRTTIVIYRADPETHRPMTNPRTGAKMRITPDGVRVPVLEKLPLAAEITGDQPAEVVLFWKDASGTEWMPQPLRVRDGLVRYEFPEIGEPITFYIKGGDYETDRLPIHIIERPYVKRIVVDYDYPDYAGMPDRAAVEGGGLYGLQGTRVKMTFEVSMPVDEAVFVLEEDSPQGAPPRQMRMSTVGGSDRTYGMSLELRRSGRYAIHLSKDGYSQARREAHRIRVVEDRLPRIEMISPAASLVETRLANIDVAFNATDDYGLKRVELVYKAEGDHKTDRPTEEKTLDDKITGPINPERSGQSPRHVGGRFKWRLAKMADLPDSGRLTYYVRAEDICPSPGRAIVRSPEFQIKLVRPSEFHREAFERAKGLLGEALLSWDNQLTAHETGGQWLTKPDDEIWAGMTDKQQRSFVAARAMRHHLRVLDEKAARNDMQPDFMSARLGAITRLLNDLVRVHHAAVERALRRARPKTGADALPKRLQALRRSALSDKAADGWSGRDRQKMSVLVLERLLRKVLDWFDLQTCIVTTKLMYEQQEEVLARTRAIAGQYIGKSILDLTDDQQKELITLGKQQKAVFDTETALERQIALLTERAERQDRRSIRDPLTAAFSVLRKRRVNDNLKKAHRMIANNQPSQIVRQQKDALAALKVVETGLIVAGRNVEADGPLTLAMHIAGRNVFQPPKPKTPPTAPAVAVGPDGQGGAETLEPAPVSAEVLPEPETTLAELIRKTAELQDSVRGRSEYLHKNSDPKVEMPRFVRLKLLRLAEWQGMAREKLDESIGKAGTDGSPPVQRALGRMREELDESAKLIAAKNVSVAAQRLQGDVVASLDDLLQLMALEKAVADVAAENRRQDGVDAFGRKYLLRDDDLRLAEEILGRLSEARLLQREVLRMEGRSGPRRKTVSALLTEAADRAAKLTAEVRDDVLHTGVEALSAEKPPAVDLLTSAVQNMRDLLEARVKPPAVVKAPPKQMTAQDWARRTSPEHLRKLLEADTRLDPEIRKRMIDALAKSAKFPPKYRKLITAYYASFVTRKEEGK